jgi:hypothetical protein
MRAGIEQLATKLRRRGLPADIQLRIGISTGYCTVGVFGSELLNAYTAIGQPVALASTFRTEARPGTILCGPSTFALLEDRVSARRTESILIPGSPAVEAYELLDAAGTDAGPACSPATEAPAEVRLFRKEGDFWTIAYEGSVIRLKDAKGLGYLAYLLGRPRREVHVLDLFSAVEGNAASAYGPLRAGLGQLGLQAGDPSDTGPVLDAAAKSAYKKRLSELHEELEEARSFNDPVRAERAQEEIDALVQALSAAVGLGGRDRKPTSTAERARLNVTRAIKSSMEKIGQNNAALGQHLNLSINTGTFCSYTPDPGLPAVWSL